LLIGQIKLLKYNKYFILSLFLSILKLAKDLSPYFSELKKMFDIVFFLCGVGMVTRISKNKFIFTGFKGMAANLNGKISENVKMNENVKMSENGRSEGVLRENMRENVCNNLKSEYEYMIREEMMFCEEIMIEKKKWNIRTSVFLMMISEQMVAMLVLSPERMMEKVELELVF
jgi:hypothetical protein